MKIKDYEGSSSHTHSHLIFQEKEKG